MANKRITDLSPITSVAGEDELAIYDVSGNGTGKVSVNTILNLTDSLYADDDEPTSVDLIGNVKAKYITGTCYVPDGTEEHPSAAVITLTEELTNPIVGVQCILDNRPLPYISNGSVGTWLSALTSDGKGVTIINTTSNWGGSVTYHLVVWEAQ